MTLLRWPFLHRHGPACPGHPRLSSGRAFKDVDDPHEAGHDGVRDLSPRCLLRKTGDYFFPSVILFIPAARRLSEPGITPFRDSKSRSVIFVETGDKKFLRRTVFHL
ncbi:MAG: hypothetical protein RH982_08785 [Parvibaculum sp.]